MMEQVRLAVIGHGLRAGGGVSVGINCIQSVLSIDVPKAVMAVLPQGVGYESAIECADALKVVWRNSRMGKLGRLAFDLTQLNGIVGSFDPHVVVCLGNIGISYNRCPQIILVQDAHYFYDSNHYFRASFFKKIMYAIQKMKLASDLRRNPLVLCQTAVAAKRLRNWYRYYEGDIRIFPNAISRLVDNGPSCCPSISSIRPFRLLCLARYYPHKNIEVLVDLFKKHGDLLRDVCVYITVSDTHGAQARQLMRAIKMAGLGECIVNLGPIDQAHIGAVYRAVNGLLMPTLLESFSGTYLEAMRFDCPILTSRLDFAEDVCGDAAYYFDPLDVDSIFSAVKNVRDDATLAEGMVKRGRERLETFYGSWSDNTVILQEAIRDLLPAYLPEI